MKPGQHHQVDVLALELSLHGAVRSSVPHEKVARYTEVPRPLQHTGLGLVAAYHHHACYGVLREMFDQALGVASGAGGQNSDADHGSGRQCERRFRGAKVRSSPCDGWAIPHVPASQKRERRCGSS
jgi:hypothetical protein